MHTLLRILLFLLIIITVALFTYAYNKTFTSPAVQEEKANVTRVVDGDTIEVFLGGQELKVRLLDINTPEKNQPYYDEAAIYLKEKIEGREVALIKGNEDKDKYGRLLRYIFIRQDFINKDVLEAGMANFYTYQNTKYTKQLKEAEQSAREEKRGIWEISSNPCTKCLSLLRVENGEGKDDCSPGAEFLEFENQCTIQCSLSSWTIKDDASHIYKFSDMTLYPNQHFFLYSGQGNDSQTPGKIILFWQNKEKCSSIWNDDHDSVFIRDDMGKLVIYRSY